MKKIFSVLLLSGLLAGCGNQNENNVSSQEEVVVAKQEEIQELEFSSGVNKLGFSQADKQNYLDIKGKSHNNKNVYVIYDGTVIDEIKTDENGNFRYNAKSTDDSSILIFSNDTKLNLGDQNIDENDLKNFEKVTATPDWEHVARIEKEQEQNKIQEIDFTSGVDELGISQADTQNYMDIKGRSNENKNVYVIYNGTIVDEIKTDSNGEFKYYSRSNDEITKIVFSNDENLKAGDLNVNTSNLKNYKEITILPNEEFVASKKEKPVSAEGTIKASNSFEIGEPIQFISSSDNSIEVTVNSLDTFSGDEWDQPEGVYFLKVDYTIENLSDYEYPANAHMFSVYDGNNEKAERISKDYFSEKIAPGKKASGVSYFDVKNEGPFEIHSLGAYWVGDTQ